eukprot:ctg_459.g146
MAPPDAPEGAARWSREHLRHVVESEWRQCQEVEMGEGGAGKSGTVKGAAVADDDVERLVHAIEAALAEDAELERQAQADAYLSDHAAWAVSENVTHEGKVLSPARPLRPDAVTCAVCCAPGAFTATADIAHCERCGVQVELKAPTAVMPGGRATGHHRRARRPSMAGGAVRWLRRLGDGVVKAGVSFTGAFIFSFLFTTNSCSCTRPDAAPTLAPACRIHAPTPAVHRTGVAAAAAVGRSPNSRGAVRRGRSPAVPYNFGECTWAIPPACGTPAR